MTRPRYRLSPGNGPRPASLEPADECEGSLLGPDYDEDDRSQNMSQNTIEEIIQTNEAPARMVNLPLRLVEDALEELYELLGERDWWKDEPRCGHQKQYEALKRTAEEVAAVVRQANAP